MTREEFSTSPYNRGSADSYYRRGRRPHYYKDKTRIEEKDMTPEEIKSYLRGYDDNEVFGDYKDWG